MRVLVVNAGSSSVKLSLIGSDDSTLAERQLAAPHTAVDPDELGAALADEVRDVDVVAHRIVHGGERFRDAVLIDPAAEAALRDLVDLAPLHQPKSLAALDAVSAVLSRTPAVACFDTAFHATLPPAAYTYALPGRWRKLWGARRYGFHGLSHAWMARRVPQLLGRAAAGLRIVSCHLGAGASLCAIADGRSVDTTMGFTPLEGLVMATRSGSVDPGLVLWLLERSDMSERELAHDLEHSSGLLGLAGSADMPTVIERARGGDEAAELALAVYVHRLRGAIGAMTASLGGVDALAFTGGVGENSADIRLRAATGVAHLGVAVSAPANAAEAPGDRDISAESARVRTLVIRAREDLEMARQARLVLAGR